jgi:hypothetical protein
MSLASGIFRVGSLNATFSLDALEEPPTWTSSEGNISKREISRDFLLSIGGSKKLA